jgi:MFS family permease
MPEPAVPARVKGLSLVSLFNDFASEMVYPVLPAFVTGPLGGSAVALGALDGAADLTAALMRWMSGRLADRKGWTKPLIFAGYGVAVLVRPLIALAGAAWQVIGFRVVDRIGKGIRSPARDAVISRITDPASRGRAFGFNRAADHFGAVLGSLFAWALLASSMGIRDVIAWSAVPGIVAIVVLLFALRGSLESGVRRPGSPESGVRSPEWQGTSPDSELRTRDSSGSAYWLPIAVLVLLTVARLPETLLLLRLQQLGVPIAMIPLAWAALHVVRSGSSYPGGFLADRLGARWSYTLGSTVYIVTALLLATDLGMAAGLGVFLAFGVVAGLTEPAERVVIGRLAPVRTGRGFGNYQALSGLAALPAGIGFGALYQAAGGPAALLGSAGVLSVGVLVWLWAGRRADPKKT